MSIRVTLLLIGWLSVLPCSVLTAQPSAPPIAAQTLTRQIDSLRTVYKIPGLQVLVFTKDSLLYERHAGVRDLKTNAPVTDQTLFPVASVTKSLVATSALMLVERKQLALTDELKKLLPEVPFSNAWEATAPVRVAHLLEHTAGFDDWSPKAYAFNDPTITLERGLQVAPESRRSRWRPGTFMSYSNAGPPLVARMLEKKTGQEFEAFVKQHIFRPLGMNQATFHRDGSALTNLATGYVNNGQQEVPYWYLLLRPTGGLNVSGRELMAFVQMLMGRGTYRGQQLLQPASVDRMETPTTTLAAQAGSVQGYGLNNFTTSYRGYLFHGHDGATTGTRAHYLYHSGLDRGIIVLVNSDGPGFGKLKDAVLATVMQPVSPQRPAQYRLTDEQKQRWIGYYRPSNFRIAITGWFLQLTGLTHVSEKQGQLVLQDALGGELVPLLPIGPDRALRLDRRGYTTEVVLVNNDADEPVLVGAFGAGMTANTATKTSFWGAYLPMMLGGLSLLLVVLLLVMGVVWLIRAVWLHRKGRRLSGIPVRLALFVYACSYLLMVAGLAQSSDPLGVVSPLSIAIFVASLLGPLAALGSLVGLIRNYTRLASKVDRIFMTVAVGSALLVVAYMAAWGLVGLRMWA